ncbi:MAG: hypothetical protein CMN73_03170 [Sphingomonas sp.]|nr:hypothetical protein [Sphingomonas sp.]
MLRFASPSSTASTRLRGAAAIAAILLTSPGATALAQTQGADAIIGRWQTEKENGVVEIHRCGDALCGRVLDGAPLRANPDQRDVRNPDRSLRDRRVRGLRVLSGFTGGPIRWTGGPLYDPESGDRASSGSLTLENANTLKVKGCIVGFLCRTQTWHRIR